MNFIIPALVFAAIGLLAGVLLTVCSKVFEVKTDERIDKVNEVLPQVNCGSCGFSGCAAYAEAIVKNGVATNLCNPGGSEVAKKRLSAAAATAMHVRQTNLNLTAFSPVRLQSVSTTVRAPALTAASATATVSVNVLTTLSLS